MIQQLSLCPEDLSKFRGGGDPVEAEQWMADALREAEARVRLLRRSVEQRLADADPRPCPQCRKPITGRPDKMYCSGRCRQEAHRTRHAPKNDDPSTMAPSRRARSA
jgi:hypothetical protein